MDLWLQNSIEGECVIDSSQLRMLNCFIRFRLVPPFGHSTIRRFASNASEMKKLAARNFEDLLQVCLHFDAQ